MVSENDKNGKYKYMISELLEATLPQSLRDAEISGAHHRSDNTLS